MSRSALNDLAGMRSGKLLVQELTPQVDSRRRRLWQCECDCGSVMLLPRQYLLRPNGYGTKSCGCTWTTRRKPSVFLIYRGEAKSIPEWARQLGISPKAIRERIALNRDPVNPIDRRTRGHRTKPKAA